jgi:predicted glutamine amidotransferase
MHNGQIGDFEHLRRPMETMLDNELYSARSGTTDSELLFLLALQFGLDRDPLGAVAEALAFVERLAERLGRPALVRFTAAFSDGRDLYAVRYATDWKAPTLYAGPMGSSGGYCLVSEPLNDDDSAWVEVPDGSAIIVGENGVDVRLFGTADLAIAPTSGLSSG